MELMNDLNSIIWDLEIKQRDSNLKITNAYRDELQDLYKSWLSDFLDELEDTPDDDRREYTAAALLLLGRRLKELQRFRLLEAFDLGLAGDPTSPYALEELSDYIKLQENYIDESLVPDLESHFFDKLSDLPEIGWETFEESLSKRAHRVGLYAVGFWAVLQAVQYWLSPPERRCTWHLNPNVVQHCSDCVELAGEWTAAALPTRPGWGETECGPGCRCFLTWEDPLEVW